MHSQKLCAMQTSIAIQKNLDVKYENPTINRTRDDSMEIGAVQRQEVHGEPQTQAAAALAT